MTIRNKLVLPFALFCSVVAPSASVEAQPSDREKIGGNAGEIVHPEASKTGLRSFGIVVGSNKGPANAETLKFADDDALRWAELLAAKGVDVRLHASLDRDTVRSFGEQAKTSLPPTKPALLRSIRDVVRAAERARTQGEISELFVVFVGHGAVDEQGEGYLQLLDDRWTRTDLFQEILDKRNIDIIHVVVDACDALFMVAGRGDDESDVIERSFANRLLRGSLIDYPHVGVLLASSAGQRAFEWSRVQGGVFSHVLRSALLGGADVDQDLQITYGEAHAFVLAALQGIQDTQLRQSVFIRPPTSFPLAPLFDLAAVRAGVAQRARVARVSRLEVHSRRGPLFHLHREDPTTMLFLEAPPFFATAGDSSYRVELPNTSDGDVVFESVVSQVQTRDVPDEMLRRGLFTVAFGERYYRGFAATIDYPTIVLGNRFVEATSGSAPGVVTHNAHTPRQNDEHAPSESVWGVRAEAGLSSRLIDGAGATLSAGGLLLWRFDETFTLQAGAIVERHQTDSLPRSPSTLHVGVPIGLAWRWTAFAPWFPTLFFRGGYSYIHAESRTGEPISSSDPLAFHLQAGIGTELSIGRAFHASCFLFGRFLFVDVDDTARTVPGGGVGCGTSWLGF